MARREMKLTGAGFEVTVGLATAAAEEEGAARVDKVICSQFSRSFSEAA